MAKIKKNTYNRKKKKGQLFMIEVLISVSFLLLLTSLIFQAKQTLPENNLQQDPSKDVYATLNSLRINLDLDAYIQAAINNGGVLPGDNAQKLVVKNALQGALGTQYKFRLTLIDQNTGDILDTINDNLVPGSKTTLFFIFYNVFTVYDTQGQYTIVVTVWAV